MISVKLWIVYQGNARIRFNNNSVYDSRTNNFSVIEKLLTYDCNLNRPGCIRLDNHIDFGTPLAIATSLKDTDYSQRAYKLSEILIKYSTGNWKGFTFEG